MKIFCKNINRYVAAEGGATLAAIYSGISSQIAFSPICALVNNKVEGLDYAVYSPKQVEFLSPATAGGRRVYVRSLCMMMYKAVADALPGVRLRFEHSISKGTYCRLLTSDGTPMHIDEGFVGALRDAMIALCHENIPFVKHEKLTKDVIEIFKAQNQSDKVLLLSTTHNLYTSYYTLGHTADSYYGPLAPSTGFLRVFDLIPYREGMLMLAPSFENPDVPSQPITQHKMYEAFKAHLKFNEVIGVGEVGQLNEAVSQNRTAELINVAEALHSKLIGRISDEIAARHKDGGAKVVLLAGPSSSGKTTTCKRLAIQLITNLLRPKMISLDDYFVGRKDTPLDESGDYDYESLYALDLERLNSDLRRLLDGETINLPTYSFELGERLEKNRPLRLEDNEILLIEGIHGLNPELTPGIAGCDLFKVYVSALTTLSIDDHNWIPTTDNRLLRRIVRDYKYRHTSALESIRRWPSVRRGEEKWIFPFQENADATFNSSLIFELGVMKQYAEPILHQVAHDREEYAEASRLLSFLSYFNPIGADQVPSTSLLREFLGGSSFNY